MSLSPSCPPLTTLGGLTEWPLSQSITCLDYKLTLVFLFVWYVFLQKLILNNYGNIIWANTVVYEYLLIFCFMYLCECLHICICTMCLTSAQRSQKRVRFHGSGLMGVVSTLVWVWVSRATTVFNCWICLCSMNPPTHTHTCVHAHAGAMLLCGCQS